MEQVLLAEAVPVFAPLRRNDWGLDPEAVAAAVTPRTKAIIINSPHNPTGAVFAKDDLLAVAAIAERHGLYVICDDTYDALFYDAPAFSLASLPQLRSRLVAVGSFSKRYALTGWRVGFAFAPEPIMGEMPRGRLGVGSGLANYARVFGQSTGFSLVGTLFSSLVHAADPMLGRTDLAKAPVGVLAAGVAGVFRCLSAVLALALLLSLVTWGLDRYFWSKARPENFRN